MTINNYIHIIIIKPILYINILYSLFMSKVLRGSYCHNVHVPSN